MGFTPKVGDEFEYGIGSTNNFNPNCGRYKIIWSENGKWGFKHISCSENPPNLGEYTYENPKLACFNWHIKNKQIIIIK